MILLIEPDAIWQSSIEQELGKIDDVEIADSGSGALKIFSERPRLVVMELQLPDMNWRDLYLELFEKTSSLLAVTHENDPHIVAELLGKGFNGYFYKPTLNFSEFQKSILNTLP